MEDRRDISSQDADGVMTIPGDGWRDPVRYWLLDAAISDYAAHSGFHLFTKRRKPRLSDIAFSDPGLTELEMVTFMEQRGASQKCIKYAREKFTEARLTGNGRDYSDSSIDRETVSEMTVSDVSDGNSVDTNRSVWHTITKPWRGFKKRMRKQPYLEI